MERPLAIDNTGINIEMLASSSQGVDTTEFARASIGSHRISKSLN